MKGRKVKWIIGGMILVFMILSFTACKKSTSPTTNLDQDAVLRLVAEDSTSFALEITDPDSMGTPKIVGVDTVKFWWRRINRVSRTINVSVYPADSTHVYPYAFVTVIDTLYGHLVIIGRDSFDSAVRIVKPLADEARKRAYFEKRGTNEDPHRGWRLMGISGLLVHSFPNNTRQINSVHLLSPGYDRIFTEDYITGITPRDSILTFQAGDSVTLTVTTGDPTDLVYLHRLPCHYYNCKPHRQPFYNNGDGTFTGTWVIGECLVDTCDFVIRHAAIDVIEYNSIYGDTTYHYDSRIWGVIYRVDTTP
jgi:hypothetical protein